jgi:hypothetical protein
VAVDRDADHVVGGQLVGRQRIDPRFLVHIG